MNGGLGKAVVLMPGSAPLKTFGQAGGQAAMDMLAQELVAEQALAAQQAAIALETPRTRSICYASTLCYAEVI